MLPRFLLSAADFSNVARVSVSRTERLLNLLIALLNTKYGLRRSELRRKVYHDASGNDVVFGRMFERDKNDLRQFGFDVETVTDLGWSEDDPATTRYRIGKESNRLPDVQLSPGEWTVLLLASQLWERAALGTAAANALRKLQASGTLSDVELPVGVQPRIKPAGQAFDDLVAAMHAQHPVSFPYLAGTTGKEEQRTVEPWGLGSRFGQWYLTGYDRSRQAPRHFRLSRFTSAVTVLDKETYSPPADFNIRAGTGPAPGTAAPDRRRGRPRRAACLGLRRRALAGDRTGSAETPDAGYERLQRPVQGRRGACRGTCLLRPGRRGRGARRTRRRRHGAGCGPQPTSARPRSRPIGFDDQPRAGTVRKRTSEDQLKRMLQLVPFLVHNQGLHIQDVAERFGVTPRGTGRTTCRSSSVPGCPRDTLTTSWTSSGRTTTSTSPRTWT